MNMIKRCGSLAATTLLCALVLSACGGGGSSGSSETGGSANSTSSAGTSASTSSAATNSSASSNAASSTATSASSVANAQTCPATSSNLYFCDDFQAGNTDNWDLTPNTGGAFSVEDTTDFAGATTKALKYTAGGTASNTVIALIKDAVWTAKLGNKADYYVEARIKPLTNGTTGNKQLYMLGRYTASNNWYLGGLNVQNSTGSTQVEAGYMKAGTITRAVQTKRAISQDSNWYKVRLEISGSTITVYMDGENLGTTTDATFTSGKIGLFTNNKSFFIDDIKVGNPADKPVLFSISPAATTYAADAGDSPYTITVNAAKSDGTTADDFSVVSDKPGVVSVSKGSTTGTSTTVTLTPLTAGTANITFTSGSDSTLIKKIAATIAPQYVDSTATYSLSASQVYPAPAATTAYTDDNLKLTFDSAPTLGSAGTIRIFKSDGTLVDRINLSGESDSIGVSGSNRRGVATTPIQISGNTVTITPHSGKLAYGTSYYVGISSTAFSGATLNGKAFAGIGKAAGWSFTTKSTAPAATLTTITVDDDGSSADYRSVQGALNHVMTNSSVSNPVIAVKNGTYNELLYLYNRAGVTIQGESRSGVVLQYNNYETLNSGSGASATGAPTSGGGRAVFFAENSDLLTLDTLTLKSTHTRASTYSNQAEVIFFKSSTATLTSGHRLIAKNADFYSEQDTLQLQGYTWFYNTKVSGNVDFIWGNNYASLFEESTIEMIGDSQYPASNASYANGTGGYILQARTYSGGKGFVFLNSSLTYADGPAGVKVATGSNASSYLARAAAGTWVDNIAFVSCKMDTHIIPVGWAANVSGNPAPNPATATASTGWREYGSMDMSGNPLTVSGRSSNSLQLTATDLGTAGLGDRNAVFSAIGWTPTP